MVVLEATGVQKRIKDIPLVGAELKTLLGHLPNHEKLLVSSSYVWALCKAFEACPIMGLDFDSELAL